MAKLVLKGLALGVAVLALAGCGNAGGERVHERLVSPDGKMEAVLMTCSMSGDAKVLLVTGAVFEKKGKGCAEVESEALASVWVSLPIEGEGPLARVGWDGGKAVFSFDGDRTVVSRQAKAGARLDLIAIKGEFEEADVMDATQ